MTKFETGDTVVVNTSAVSHCHGPVNLDDIHGTEYAVVDPSMAPCGCVQVRRPDGTVCPVLPSDISKVETGPKPGDRVRVTYVGTVDAHGHLCGDSGLVMGLASLRYADIEIIEAGK